MQKALIVIPCYNEEARLDPRGFLPLLSQPGVGLLFVNDGSRDGTFALLSDIQANHPGQVHVLDLERNSGKAEAVRRGMIRALELDADITGFLDADLATPADECLRMLRLLQALPPDRLVILGARVKLLGRDIQRSPVRHLLGRVFATAASMLLVVPVYDTQCGAKLFRRHPVLEAALSEPFGTRWVFDVELLGRLLRGTRKVPALPLASIIEEPLLAWRDVKGSKLGPMAMLGAAADLLRIWHRLGAWKTK